MSEQQKVVEAISEATLDEVAGGVGLSAETKEKFKKGLKAAGVLLLGGGVAVLGAGKFGIGPATKLFKKEEEEEKEKEE